MSLATGGFELGATSTRSSPDSCARRRASSTRTTPTCSPPGPTRRTWVAVMRSLTRGSLLMAAPSVPQHAMRTEYSQKSTHNPAITALNPHGIGTVEPGTQGARGGISPLASRHSCRLVVKNITRIDRPTATGGPRGHRFPMCVSSLPHLTVGMNPLA